MAETMRRLMPDLAQTLPLYPFGYEHRKVWDMLMYFLALTESAHSGPMPSCCRSELVMKNP
jgi:hypothetical protein